MPTIRQQLGTPNLGIGLRLGRAGVEALNDRANLEELQDFLNGGYSVFTVNAFPYGPFHGEQVKENVYAPDWSTNERLVYTNTVASVLAELAVVNLSDRNAHNFASISTVPGSFKPWVSGREEAIRQNLVSSVAKLVDIKRASGVEIALALEPEPFCMLETIAETVDWFKDYGFSSRSCEQLAKLCGVSESQAEQLLHTHLGVCYDVCHAAVEYESASDSLRTLKAEGISIPKIQLSSALRVASMTPALAEKLRLFNEEVYLHQVIQRRAGQNSGNDDLVRFLDLPQALESLAAGEGAGSEWRTHFHVPVFLDKLEHFDTTQFFSP